MEDLPKAFEANQIESQWYDFWISNHCFQADPHSSKQPFSMVMPPPNVTGVLHMGHALVNTLQDVLARWKRMSGYEVLWIPGTDHAGIATQTVVERNLIKNYGKRRKDFSREEFLQHVWSWKEQSQHTILEQLKKLGCSCDWSRLCFTMDESRNLAVRTAFKKLFDQGLIYRGDYLVNWDPQTQTALADDEVEYEERNSFLWHLRYPLTDHKNEYIIVATTRPETMLADVAVAVNPSDVRYQKWIGKKITLPLSDGRTIPIIADPFVDPSFGTGAVKITPAHDRNDYEMAIRHSLEMINMMTKDGKVNEISSQFQGLTMEEARLTVAKTMDDLGLLAKKEPHTLRVGISYRSKAVIEPYLSKQWFIKMSVFQKELKDLVQEKKVELFPSSWETTYFHWIDNLRDWCISRQLWWGHRIPVWYHKANPEEVICFDGDGVPEQVQNDPEAWQQDEDVLDTWFSSALWPFSTMGWPIENPVLKKFYPTNTLVTGHDILFFWVARMIMMGSHLTETPPFSKTYLHGLIYGKSYWKTQEGTISYITGEERIEYDLGKPLPKDVEFRWEKMSKSKGNIIDPLEIIEKYGTDAMRLALSASASQAKQIDLDRRRFEEYKNFANKIWNGARFVFMNVSSLSEEELCKGIDRNSLQLEDRWILSLLNKTIEQVQKNLEEFQFDKATTASYNFFWNEFCAYYLEIAKPILNNSSSDVSEKSSKQKILVVVLSSVIRLMHPIAPFITEELYAKLKKMFPNPQDRPEQDAYTQETLIALRSPCCMLAPYPKVIDPSDINESIETDFSLMNELVRCVRNIRAEMQIPPSLESDIFIIDQGSSAQWQSARKHQSILRSLVKVGKLDFIKEQMPLSFCSEALLEGMKIVIPLPSELRTKEHARLTKEVDKIQSQLNGLKEKLSNTEFLSKAPQNIVEKLKGQAMLMDSQIQQIEAKLKQLT